MPCYLPGAGGDLCKFAQSPEGVAPVHVIQRLGAVPQQAEAHRVFGAVVLMMLVTAPQLLLNNPGGGYEAEAADGHQGGGQEHPEAAHAAEHGGGGLGQRTRGQTQTDPEPGFVFFLLPAQEPMHLELAAFQERDFNLSSSLCPALHEQQAGIRSVVGNISGCSSAGPQDIWSVENNPPPKNKNKKKAGGS